MTNILPAEPGDTNPTGPIFADNREYGDAICEIVMLAQSSEDTRRLGTLISAALKYVAASAREKALNEAVEAVRGESLAGDSDTLVAYRQGVSNAAAAVEKLLGGAR